MTYCYYATVYARAKFVPVDRLLLIDRRLNYMRFVRTIEMKLKQKWNKSETKVSKNFWNCFEAVLFQFRFSFISIVLTVLQLRRCRDKNTW